MIPSQYLRAVRLRRDEVPSFREYPFDLPAVRNLRSLRLHPAVTCLIGENGTGKSTLLEAIAVAWGFNPEGSSRNFRFSTRESHSELSRYLQLERGTRRAHDGYFLRAESFYNVATEIERIDAMDMAAAPPLGRTIRKAYGDRSLHEQSHGGGAVRGDGALRGHPAVPRQPPVDAPGAAGGTGGDQVGRPSPHSSTSTRTGVRPAAV